MHPRQPHDLDDEDGRTQQKHVAAVKASAILKKTPGATTCISSSMTVAMRCYAKKRKQGKEQIKEKKTKEDLKKKATGITQEPPQRRGPGSGIPWQHPSV